MATLIKSIYARNVSQNKCSGNQWSHSLRQLIISKLQHFETGLIQADRKILYPST